MFLLMLFMIELWQNRATAIRPVLEQKPTCIRRKQTSAKVAATAPGRTVYGADIQCLRMPRHHTGHSLSRSFMGVLNARADVREVSIQRCFDGEGPVGRWWMAEHHPVPGSAPANTPHK